MSHFIIRAIAPGDLDVIVAIEQLAYSAPWLRSIFVNCETLGARAWVGCLEDEVIAYCYVLLRHDVDHLLNICVNPAQQGRGFASQLLQHCLEDSRFQQAESLTLEVRRSNLAAQRLYEGNGFIESGLRKDYYPTETEAGREDGLVYSYQL